MPKPDNISPAEKTSQANTTPSANATSTDSATKAPTRTTSQNKILAVLASLAALWLVPLLYQQLHQYQYRYQDRIEFPYGHPGDIGDFDNVGTVIGIELGESYSRVAIAENGKVTVILNEHGEQQTPNYVAFTGQGILVGQEAKDQAGENVKGTVYDVRRLLGRKFSQDPTLQADIDSLLYDVVNINDRPLISLSIAGTTKLLSPEDISSHVVHNLKSAAEAYLGVSYVGSSVITVPSYFTDDQRQATRDAALIAGLNVLRVVNEPTAAGIAHKLDEIYCLGPDCESLTFVYALGEKSVDVTVLAVDGGVFEIMAQEHRREFGEEDISFGLRDAVVKDVCAKTGVDPHHNQYVPSMMGRIFRAIEKAKVGALVRGKSFVFGIEDYRKTLTPSYLDDLRRSILEEHIPQIERVLRDAKTTKNHIHKIILIGNASHVALIQPYLEAFFNNAKVLDGLDPSLAVVRGAAHQAGILSGDDDSGCCFGFYITPLALGIETADGVFEKIIARSTIIPNRKSRNFTTTVDRQERAVLRLMEGVRLMAEDNKELGMLEMVGLTPRPAGETIIEMAFEVDAYANLTIEAREIGQEGMGVRVEWKGQLAMFDVAQIDLDKQIMDAEAHLEDDRESVKLAREVLLAGSGQDLFGVAVTKQAVEVLNTVAEEATAAEHLMARMKVLWGTPGHRIWDEIIEYFQR